MRTFKIITPPVHALSQFRQIQASDFTQAECEYIRSVVTNQYTESLAYKFSKACGAFLQGYDSPYRADSRDGWILIEFWTDNNDAIEAFVMYLTNGLNRIFYPNDQELEEGA